MFARKGEGSAKPAPKLKVSVLQGASSLASAHLIPDVTFRDSIAGLALRGPAEFKKYFRGESMQLFSRSRSLIYIHIEI